MTGWVRLIAKRGGAAGWSPGAARAQVPSLSELYPSESGAVLPPQLCSTDAATWALPVLTNAVVGTPTAALEASARLRADGFWVGAIRPPTVPAGTARLRVTLSATHRDADVDALLEALARARDAAGGDRAAAWSAPP